MQGERIAIRPSIESWLEQAHRGRKVVIASRGAANRAVFVGEDYLSGLEVAAKKLCYIESGNAGQAFEFKLIGSGRIAEGVTDPLADIRAEQLLLWEKKLASFGR
jgi:hypothetical protein